MTAESRQRQLLSERPRRRRSFFSQCLDGFSNIQLIPGAATGKPWGLDSQLSPDIFGILSENIRLNSWAAQWCFACWPRVVVWTVRVAKIFEQFQVKTKKTPQDGRHYITKKNEDDLTLRAVTVQTFHQGFLVNNHKLWAPNNSRATRLTWNSWMFLHYERFKKSNSFPATDINTANIM